MFPMSVAPLEQRLLHRARELGFELAGIAPATNADGFCHLQEWLARGCAGEMDYMRRHEGAREHPQAVLPDVRSVVMVGLNYFPGPDGRDHVAALHGRIARYAAGADYHDVMRGKLTDLLAWAQQEAPGLRGRGVVDTAPLLERDFARRAGLGWFGKNTMLINKRLGSCSISNWRRADHSRQITAAAARAAWTPVPPTHSRLRSSSMLAGASAI
jgi:epoxyqueuosine reductase